MIGSSAKHAFLERGQSGEDQDYFDNLIQVEPSNYKPGPTGTLAHMSLSRTRLIRGGLGSGKTRWAGEHLNNLALQYPGALILIGRKDITSLKVTTQKEFLEMVVRPETIHSFNVNDNNLYYKNGSQVIFRDTKDKAKVKSLQLTAYMIDEADENEDEDIWSYLDDRLRQQFIQPDGTALEPPFCGLLVFNPTDEDHWLYKLSLRRDIDVEDFRFSTYENTPNLPRDYIPNLERKLPPWERKRLLEGHFGRAIKGKPVYHGFTEQTHVKPLQFRPDLPLLRGWDFGFKHPAVSFWQIDHTIPRFYIHREFLGENMRIDQVVPHVKEITASLCGPNYVVMDYGDPHGADEKDTSVSSIEHLRIKHGIFVQYQRSRIKTGIDEIQDKILGRAVEDPTDPDCKTEAPQLLIDPRAKIHVDSYLGGYHRGEDGLPVKDGYFDHLCDTDRYIVVNNMNRILAHRRQNKRYRPKNFFTGY